MDTYINKAINDIYIEEEDHKIKLLWDKYHENKQLQLVFNTVFTDSFYLNIKEVINNSNIRKVINDSKIGVDQILKYLKPILDNNEYLHVESLIFNKI